MKVPSRLQHDYSLETPKETAGKCIGRILKVLSKQIVIFFARNKLENFHIIAKQ